MSHSRLCGGGLAWSRVLAKDLRKQLQYLLLLALRALRLETGSPFFRSPGRGQQGVSGFSLLPGNWGRTRPSQHSAFSSPALSQVGVPSRFRFGPCCGLFPYLFPLLAGLLRHNSSIFLPWGTLMELWPPHATLLCDSIKT